MVFLAVNCSYYSIYIVDLFIEIMKMMTRQKRPMKERCQVAAKTRKVTLSKVLWASLSEFALASLRTT